MDTRETKPKTCSTLLLVGFLACSLTSLAEAQNRRPPASGNRPTAPAIKPDDPYFYRKVGLSPEGVKLADEAMAAIQKIKARAKHLQEALPKSTNGAIDWKALNDKDWPGIGKPIESFASSNYFVNGKEVTISRCLQPERTPVTLRYLATLELAVNGAIQSTNSFPDNLETLPYAYSRLNLRLRAGARVIYHAAHLPNVPTLTSPTAQDAFEFEDIFFRFSYARATMGYESIPTWETESVVMQLAMNARNAKKKMTRFNLLETRHADFFDYQEKRTLINRDYIGMYSPTLEQINRLLDRTGDRYDWGFTLAADFFKVNEGLSESGLTEFLKARAEKGEEESLEFRRRLIRNAFAPFMK